MQPLLYSKIFLVGQLLLSRWRGQALLRATGLLFQSEIPEAKPIFLFPSALFFVLVVDDDDDDDDDVRDISVKWIKA